MSKSPQYNQQSRSKVKEICIYQNMESGCHSIYIWKKIVGSMPERIQAIIFESNDVQWSFIHQKAHLCLRPCSVDNTLKRPFSAWDSFNITQKLGLFVLGVIHISNLPTVCVKWMRVGGLSTLVLRFHTWNNSFC